MTPAVGTRMHPDVQLEYIFSYWATVTQPEMIGPLAEGMRMNVYVVEGEVTGPKLRGRFRQGGGDWLTLRSDGVAVLDVRGTIEAENGALIYMTYSGICEAGTDGYDRFQRGDAPERMHIRIAPRYFTSHPDYLWLNRLQCVGVGEVEMATMRVTYDIYAMR